MMDVTKAAYRETIGTLIGLADEAFLKGDRDVTVCAIEAVYAHFDRVEIGESSAEKIKSRIMLYEECSLLTSDVIK
jgi:hypothetical protein